jgi:ketosteroid isomerase-like protein
MIVRRLFHPVLALALASVACQPPAQEPADLSADDVAAIQGSLDAVVEGELAGDWEAVSEAFADDAVFMMPNTPSVEGKAAWLQVVEAMSYNITDLTVEVDDIEGRGDLAYVRGTYNETYLLGDAVDPTVADGKFVWILNRQPDGWKVVVAIVNSNLPLEET